MSTSVFAQNISWNFATASSTTNTTTNVTSSALTSGNSNGVTTLISTTSASSGYTGSSGTQNAGVAARIGALDVTATTGSAYFEVTLSSSDASSISLSSISFGSRSTGTGPKSFTLRSGADNFASDLIVPGTLTSNSTWALYTATLTSPLSTTSSVVIRIYGYGGAGSPSAGTTNWRIDDLILTFGGTPPPASVSPASNLTFSNVQTTSVTLTFDKTNYVDSVHQALVFFKQDAAVTQGTPSMSATDYTAETDFQLAGTAYQHDAAAKCVLNSDLNSVTVTNLVPGKTYHALVYIFRQTDSVYSAAATANVMTIDTAPAPEYPLYAISQINRTNTTTGEPDSLGKKVTVRGIVIGYNRRPAGLEFVLNDATGGTTVFNSGKNFGYTVAEGDSIYAQGTVATYRGLHEINADTVWKGGAASVTINPVTVTTLDETSENKLVRLNNVRFATAPTGSTWATAATNYRIVNTSNDTFTLRLLPSSALAGQALPTTPTFNATGLVVQFSTSSTAPYLFNGYQIFPRSASDIIEITPPPVQMPVAISSVNATNMTTGNPQRLGDTVFVRGIALGFNQRATGLLFVIDDATGGISLFNSSKSFGYTVTEGDSVYAKGIVGTFRGLTQIVLDTLWKVNGTSTIYTPIPVTTLTESNENKLVRLNGVSFETAPAGNTWPTTSTSINIITAQSETVVIRLVANSGLAGQPLPTTETFDVIGLQGQFSSSPATPFAFDGYQIFPRTASDIIENSNPEPADSIGAFNLITVANNTVISVDSPYTNTYVISWNKPELFGNIDSVWYYFDLDTIGGDFTDPLTLFESNGNPDDTTFTLTEQEVKDLMDDLGMLPGQTFYGKWQIWADSYNAFAVSTQTFNITIDYVLSSGLKNIAFDNMLSVYPNPASKQVTVKHSEKLEKVELFNAVGQKVLAQHMEGLNKTSLNVESLPKGLYFITIYGSNGNSATRKLVVE